MRGDGLDFGSSPALFLFQHDRVVGGVISGIGKNCIDKLTKHNAIERIAEEWTSGLD